MRLYLLCADNAKFGLPEVTLGVIPGIGGTQRLTLAIGKAKAMEMCLTARQMGAVEAEQSGLVAQVFPKEELVEKTLKAAEKIAEKSVVATMMIKKSQLTVHLKSVCKKVYALNVEHSIRFLQHQDQKEGMQAFVEKRQANFKNN